MRRSVLVYPADVVEACEAIEGFLGGADLEDYLNSAIVRSAVERQLILIGEAVGSLLPLEPELSTRISHARRIVDFRNQLAHNHGAIDNTVVWAIASDEVPMRWSECRAVLAERVLEKADSQAHRAGQPCGLPLMCHARTN